MYKKKDWKMSPYHFYIGDQVAELQPGSPVKRKCMDCLNEHLNGLLQQVQFPQHHSIPEHTPTPVIRTVMRRLFVHSLDKVQDVLCSQVKSEAVQLPCPVLPAQLHPQFPQGFVANLSLL